MCVVGRILRRREASGGRGRASAASLASLRWSCRPPPAAEPRCCGVGPQRPLRAGPWRGKRGLRRRWRFRGVLKTLVGSVGRKGPSWGTVWSGRPWVRGAPPKEGGGGVSCSRVPPLCGCSSVKFEKRTFSSPVKKGFSVKYDGSHQKPRLLVKLKKQNKTLIQ